MKLKAGVVGATGYTGEEIVKLLSRHNEVKITSLTAIIDKPTRFSDLFPVYKGSVDMICKELDIDEVISSVDVVFLALPHTVSMQFVPKFLKAGKKIIDLSADYRLDAKTYTDWYKADHTDKRNLSTAIYGLPELYRSKIKQASLIANPGCYPTATILAACPAVEEGIIGGEMIVDAKSGVTGAGRKASLSLSFGEVDENLKAYKINEHQHMPEMVSILSKVSKGNVKVNFTPHVIPMRRGILSTVYIPLKKRLSNKNILAMYKKYYKDEPFVRIYDSGILPEIKNVVNTNYCDLGLKVTDGLLIVVSCIDNLLKGAAGQAVQNMNIMCGFEEKTGLI